MFILGEIMKEKHFTSKMLAEVTGIPKQTIDAYRSNFRRKEPSFSNGLKIADALGIDPHEIIGESPKRIEPVSGYDKWKEYKDGHCEFWCSVCEFRLIEFFEPKGNSEFNFCPHCGARMDVKNEKAE